MAKVIDFILINYSAFINYNYLTKFINVIDVYTVLYLQLSLDSCIWYIYLHTIFYKFKHKNTFDQTKLYYLKNICNNYY